MSQPQTNPEVLRRRLSSGLPEGYGVAYLKHEDAYTVRRKDPSVRSVIGKEVLRRPRKTVEKWRNPESTIAFAVKDAERRRR